MSNAVFPSFPGLTWDITREPIWSTTSKASVSQREYRSANVSYPRYRYKLKFAVLRATAALPEMATLAGFFNARMGDFDSFLYTDPDDNSVTAQAIGLGDGANKAFQLVRTFGGFVEPVFDANSAPLIYVNGVLKTVGADYTVGTTGVITFTAAPGVGQAVTWTGTFYRRVKFEKSSAEFNQFMKRLWDLKSLDLLSVKP